MSFRHAFAATALTLATAAALPATGRAQPADDICAGASPTSAFCIGQQKLAEAAAAECKRLGRPASQCTLPIGHQVGDDVARNYQHTWLHRAAAFQYRLGDPISFGDAQWLGTHNSFNSVNDAPTASHTDSNQQLSLAEQLDVDMRALELDLHYIPSAAAGGAKAVVVCHGRGPDEANAGCTNEPLFSQVLPRVANWLRQPARKHEVILLYLEDELGDSAGYAHTVAQLDSVLRRPDGRSMIYKPSSSKFTAKGCANLPLSLDREDVRERGAQVVLVGNCRSGWASDVFGWDDVHLESGSTPKYRAFPGCDGTYSSGDYRAKLVRYYEDSTFVSAAIDPTSPPAEHNADRLAPDRVSAMTRCGVNLFGFDQLLPDDGRIDASIWSWAPHEPNAARGRCALQRGDSRWATRDCRAKRRAACHSARGWSLTRRAFTFHAAGAACRSRHARFEVPRTGNENSLLSRVAGKTGVWLHYRLPPA
jgi:hypothetical protein